MSLLQAHLRELSRVFSSSLSLAWRPFCDFLFPPVCLVCGSSVTPSPLALCETCRQNLHRADRNDAPYAEALARLRDEGLIRDLFAPFYFSKEGPLRTLVHELKYAGMQGIGVALGKEIGQRLAEEGKCTGVDFLIPVPLHRARLRERGYNQSACLCHGISAVTGIPLLDRVLLRRRNTPTQTALSAPERVGNVAGAFAVRSRAASCIRGRTILLVDDVVTTGATVRACASVLRTSGAARIDVAASAIAVS